MAVRMTTKLRKRLCNISDENCVLIKFLNANEEDYTIAFSNWLKNYGQSNFDITAYIKDKTETLIFLPSDLQLQPSKLLTKHLGNAKFCEEPVTLISNGDWITLKKQLKSLQSTGKLDVSKNSRKRVMRKATSPSPLPKSQSKIKALKAAKATAQEDNDQQLLKKQQKLQLRTAMNWESIEDDNENSSTIGNKSKSGKKNTDDSGLGDVEEESDSGMPPLRVKKKKGHTSKNQYDEPEVSLASDEEQPNLVVTPSRRQKRQSRLPIIIPYQAKTPSLPVSPVVRVKKIKLTNVQNSDSEEEDDSNSSKRNLGNDDTDQYESFERDLNKTKTSSAVKSSDDIQTSKVNLPAGVKRAPPLPENIIKMCFASKKLQSFISGLTDNFFEKQYLAAHSPTGQIPNALAKLGVQAKPALHPPTVQYIRELAAKYFGHQVGIQGKVTKVLSDKISGARPKNTGQTTASGIGKRD